MDRKGLNQTYDEDIRTRLNELYVNSKNGLSFKNLKKSIINHGNFILAMREISYNSGRETPGPNGLKYSDIRHNARYEDFVDWFRNMKPMNSRLVWIPKKNGKMRPLGIANIEERVIQQMIFNIIEPICEGKFKDVSFGFRREVSAKDAIHKAVRHGMTNPYAVEIDFKDFFNNIPHWKIIQCCWDIGIRDKYVLKCIKIILKSPVDGIVNNVGVPQGGILSPLLSNIVLHELDKWVLENWVDYKPNTKSAEKNFHSKVNSFSLKVPTDKTYKITYSSLRNYKDGVRKINKSMIKHHQRKINLKQGYYVRYADDFIILCKNINHAKRWYYAVIEQTMRMGLTVNNDKSKISDLRKGITFLGYNIKLSKEGTQRWSTRKIYKPTLSIDSNNKDKYIKFGRERLKQLYYNRIDYRSWNSFVTGVVNYFDYTTHFYKSFEEIQNAMESRYRKLHGRNGWKYSLLPNKYLHLEVHGVKLSRYKNRKVLYRIVNGELEVLHIWNHRAKDKYIYDRPSFPQSRVLWDKREHKLQDIFRTQWYKTQKYMRRKTIGCEMYFSSLLSVQKCKCRICKNTLYNKDTEVHHIHMLSNGGSDTYKNLVLLCRSCHKDVHSTFNTSNEVLLKYRGLLNQ